MRPLLRDGDHVLVVALPPKPGTVVALLHPRLGRMVKRLGLDGTLHSDSSEGTASDRLGLLSDATYLGRAVLRARGLKQLRARRPYSPRA